MSPCKLALKYIIIKIILYPVSLQEYSHMKVFCHLILAGHYRTVLQYRDSCHRHNLTEHCILCSVYSLHHFTFYTSSLETTHLTFYTVHCIVLYTVHSVLCWTLYSVEHICVLPAPKSHLTDNSLLTHSTLPTHF